MARYDWPMGPRESSEDRAQSREDFNQRLWADITDELLVEARDGLTDLLMQLVQAGMSILEIERRRWLPIGPSSILRGQATGRPMVAGRIRDIKRSPDGSRIYAASAYGGVWYSGDGGNSWNPLGGTATVPKLNAGNRTVNSLVIGCLHVDWGADDKPDTVYAGTGEARTDFASRGIPHGSNGGVGVLKLVRSANDALDDPDGTPWAREATNLTGWSFWRIARDPAHPGPDSVDTVLVAATTGGLYMRKGPFVPNVAWTPVPAASFGVQDMGSVRPTDVVWVPEATAPNPAKARLFVALVNSGDVGLASGVYVSEDGTKGPFTLAAPLGVAKKEDRRRIALAAAMPLAATPTTHPQVAYALTRAGAKGKPLLWRIDGTMARTVRNLPPPLFGGSRVGGQERKTEDLSWHSMAIAVDPSNPQRVFLGGSSEYSSSQWNAALYRCSVSGTAAANDFALDFKPVNNQNPAKDATFVGNKVHADIHAIAVSEDGKDVWVGCDGGVFASASQGAAGSYLPQNDGLAVAHCLFVASHPHHPGPAAAGTQDNGAIRRVGDTIWEMPDAFQGDGGGVCFHPDETRSPFLATQYIYAKWRGNGHFDQPVHRAACKASDYAYEMKRSLFYSGGAAAPGAAPGKARLAIGTYRVWLTEEWNPHSPAAPAMRWRTLPSRKDPVKSCAFNTAQDSLLEGLGKIISVKWLDPGVASGGSFTGASLLALYERAIVRLYQEAGKSEWQSEAYWWGKRPTPPGFIPANLAPMDRLPPLGAWSEIAPHRATKPADPAFKGSFYISTTGVVADPLMDTLWWFDGVHKFYPTGLRDKGTKAPAFSAVCDPDKPEIVYVGTAVGVWKGVLDEIGTAASPGPLWTWEMYAIGLPEAFVQDLSIHRHAGGQLKLLRAAVQSRGVWEADISDNPVSVGRTFVRVHPLDTRQILPTSLINLSDEKVAKPRPYPRCLSPDIALLPRTAAAHALNANPTESQLAGASEKPVLLPKAGQKFQSHKLKPKSYSAFVLVHHRHTSPLAADKIRVALLKRPLTPAERDGGDILLSPAWRTAVRELLVDGTGGMLDDGWTRVEQTGAPSQAVSLADTVKNPAAAVDARTPRAAAFTLDLTGVAAGKRFLLLAVVSSTADPLTAAELGGGATIADLVLGCRHAGARAVHL